MVETARRQEQDRTCKAKKRASETMVEMVQRQEQNRGQKRALVVPMENVELQMTGGFILFAKELNDLSYYGNMEYASVLI